MIWGCGLIGLLVAALFFVSFVESTLGLTGGWWWALGFLGWLVGIFVLPHARWSYPAYLSIPLVILVWAVWRQMT
jgi:hypothetical protein